MLKLGILGSGKGTNFQAIIDAIKKGELSAEVAVVLSDVEDAYILERARREGINAFYIPPGRFKTKLEPEVEEKYVEKLKEYKVELVVLAGFMRILKDIFLDAFPGRIMNIHPSLLPAFRGLEAWRQVLEYGVRYTGCTVHFVDKGMDTGPIILQSVVPVLQEDTPESLHQRIQVEEHKLYPRAIQLFAENRLEIMGRKVIIKGDVTQEID